MRRKLLVGLVTACALVGVLVGPASASAAKITLNNGLGEPASEADFSGSVAVSSTAGSWYCPNDLELETDITSNGGSVAVLDITGGSLGACTAGSGKTLTYSEFDSNGPMTLNPDGTGAIGFDVKEVRADNGKVLWTCTRTGTLYVTKTGTSPLSFSFASNKLEGTGCGYSYVLWNGNFNSVTDEFGLPIEWSVPPSLDSVVTGEAASAADFWDANLTVTSFAKWTCEEFDLQTAITKNENNPINLVSSGTSTISGCKSGGATLSFSGIETTSAMTLYADGSGSLPLRLTETTSGGGWSCVREGTLTLDANPAAGDVSFTGSLKKVSGTAGCPTTAKFEGTFTRVTDEFGSDVQWIGFS